MDTVNPEILRDQALTERESDRFGYSDIADDLIKLIRKATPPFTIGLYGQWGVGKSTICKIVEGEIAKDDNYKVFYFDTWKYEKDSFRRQFLIELDEDVFQGKLDYRKKLNQSLTLPHSLPFWDSLRLNFTESIRAITARILVPAVILVPTLIIVWLVIEYSLISLGTTYSAVVSGLNLIGVLGLLIFISKFILESVKLVEATVDIPKTDSAEGFEFYYKEALQKLGDYQKLLIIVDNLDRLDSEKAVDLLGDIKTFLASEKVSKIKNRAIFLIPCDNGALSTQLKAVYTDLDAEEFLRKFFNLSLKIPKLLDLELDDYVTEKLQTTKVPDFKDNYPLSFVISRAFRNNPREIIQFVNSLIALYLLAVQRNLSIVSKEKIPFLAKVLIIRIKWPEIYNYIEVQIIREGRKIEDIEIKEFGDDESGGVIDFRDFLKATDIVTSEDGQEVYFSIKESEGQKTVPEWNTFISAAEDRKDEAVLSAYEQILKGSRVEALNLLLARYVYKNRSKEAKLANVFVSVSKLISESNLEKFEAFAQGIFSHLNSNNLAALGASVDYGFVFNPSFVKLNGGARQLIVSKLKDLVDAISRQEKADPTVVKSDLRIWKTISDNETLFSRFRNELVASKKMYIHGLKTDALFPPAPIQTPPVPAQTDIDLLNELLKFVSENDPIDSGLNPEAYQFLFYILQYAPLQVKDIQISILEAVNKFLLKTRPPYDKTEPIFAAYRQIVSQLHALSNNADVDIRSLTLPALLKLNSSVNPQADEMYNRIGEYLRTIAYPVERILSTFSEVEIRELLTKQAVKNGLTQRTGDQPELFLKLKLEPDFFTEGEWQQILTRLANQNANGFMELATYLDHKIPDKIRDPIVLAMVKQVNFSDPDLVQRWLETMAKIGMSEANIQELIPNLRVVCNRGEEFKKIVRDFASKNVEVIGTSRAEEFIKMA